MTAMWQAEPIPLPNRLTPRFAVNPCRIHYP